MGRKLNLSTPTVINTELHPLDESFYIEANGQLEQWFYDNTAQYAPDRTVTPLILTPRISVTDADSKQSYTPAFNYVRWFVNEWNASSGNYVETEVLATADSGTVSYFKQGNNLVVKKNVTYAHGVTIRCVAVYIDPSDAGITYEIRDSITLSTNRDATVTLPEVAITSPSTRTFNPLSDYDEQGNQLSQFDVEGVIINSPDVVGDEEHTDVVQYESDGYGTEEVRIAEDSVLPILSIRHPDGDVETDASFAFRRTANGTKWGVKGTAHVENVKGNTVVWNQLLKEGRLVDMGLPSGTLWASCDIDVTKEDKFCDTPFTYDKSFFSWGNIDGHNPISNTAFDYNWGGVNSEEPYYEGQPYGETKGNTLTGNIPVGDEYDAARANLGSIWRMPTTEEFIELFANTIYIDADGTEVDTTKADKRVTVNGVKGLYVQSKLNGARLFFSCSGNGAGRSLSGQRSSGHYLSSTWVSVRNAWYLYFGLDGVGPHSSGSRYGGYAVRPVLSKSTSIEDGHNGHKYSLSSNNKNITDVTLTYGAGNEPAAVSDFEADFRTWFGRPMGAEPYDKGSLIPMMMTGLKSVGFNQYNVNGKTGHSLEWNQYINPSTIATASNEFSDISFNNGSFSYKFTSKSSVHGSGIGIKNFIFIEGHKYYYSSQFDVAPDNLSYYYFRGVGTNIDVMLGTNKEIKGIYSCTETQTSSITMVGMVVKATPTTTDIKQSNYNIIDLTLIYGEGNEPTTPEQFEADYQRWFGKPLVYEEYDAGSTRTVQGVDIRFLEVPYFVRGDVSVKCDNGTMLRPTGRMDIPMGVHTVFGGDDDTCINILTNTSKDGSYEAYMENVVNLDVTKLKGRKAGDTVSSFVFPDGMKRVGDVYDEIKVEDGKVVAVKRIGSVDLGTLSWMYNTYDNHLYFKTPINSASAAKIVEPPSQAYKYHKLSCAKYINDTWVNIYNEINNKAVGIYHVDVCFVVCDSSYTDATTFKAAMSGVMLYYELANPEEYILDPIQLPFALEWYGIKGGNEVLAETLPWYVGGQNTDTLTVDAMYGEDINVVLRAKNKSGVLSPSKAYANIAWRIPNIDTNVLSHNGGAVRSDTVRMLFGNIVNIRGQVLADERKKEHLRFNWKYRPSTSSQEVDAGWGDEVTIEGGNLRHVRGSQGGGLASTLVFPYVYLLGAYEAVTDDGEEITDDGDPVFDRPL